MPKSLPLQQNDTIAIVAPASAPLNPERIEKGARSLRERGFKVELSRSTYDPFGYLCGDDETRLKEFNDFLRRPDIRALFCVRGGYGSLRLLPYLDYEAARRFPKLIVGYSDITALHLAFLTQANLPGIAGPMVAVEWPEPDPASESLFWQIAGGNTVASVIGPDGESLIPVKPGNHEGTLIGGNLTLITRLIGTPFLPDLTGAILFIEEIGEEPYRIDGLFAHLKLSGILDRLGGLIIGGITDWEPQQEKPTLSLDEVLHFYTDTLQIPIARGLQFGHFPKKNTLPVGVRARLTVERETATLSIQEAVVLKES